MIKRKEIKPGQFFYYRNHKLNIEKHELKAIRGLPFSRATYLTVVCKEFEPTLTGCYCFLTLAEAKKDATQAKRAALSSLKSRHVELGRAIEALKVHRPKLINTKLPSTKKEA